MAEPQNGAVHIGALNLSIPGAGAAVGHEVARGVGEHLANAQIPPGVAARHLGALSLQATARPGAGTAELSESIARAVIRAITNNDNDGGRGRG